MFCFIRSRIALSQLSLPGEMIYSKENSQFSDQLYHLEEARNLSDSLSFATSTGYILFEGALINSKALRDAYATQDNRSLLALASERESLLSELTGQYRGLFQEADKLRCFTDPIRSSLLFYYLSPDLVIVCSSLKLICKMLQNQKRSVLPDPVGMRILLSFGYQLEDYTTISGIRSLKAGQILELNGFEAQFRAYHSFNNEPLYDSLQSSLPRMHELFNRAVALSYDYDLEKGRQHLAFLSGGLDSRIGVYSATAQGYTGIHALCFSQSRYPDHLIAARISRELELDFHFVPLESGDYLLSLEKNAGYNDAQIILSGAAHLDYAIQSLPLERFGILHSGQIGDLILGSFLSGVSHSPVQVIDTAFSKISAAAISSELQSIGQRYPNQELFALYNRGFNSASNGDYACARYNHSFSPFLEQAFTQFTLNISPALRFDNQLYRRWYMEYYPRAAAITWEKTLVPVAAGASRTKLFSYYYRASRRVGRLFGDTAYSMNPFEYWWNCNPALRTYFEPRFRVPESIRENLDKDILIQVENVFRKGSFSEKLQAYTLSYGLERLLAGD